MYSRPPNRDSRIPPNYGGSIFSRNSTVTPVENLTHRRIPPPQPHDEPLAFTEEEVCETPMHTEEHTEEPSAEVCATTEEKRSLLSPLGHLGTEELLLLALALIIFQDGKEPELALILLALLFIN